MRRATIVGVSVCLALCVAIRAARGAAPLAGFDEYVARVLNTFEVPGAAVAIVKDGAVVLARGYGVRRLGDAAPADSRTLFGIASNTKLFTATALGLLVEDGKIEWDAPVTRYLPAFALADAYVTRHITVRDLLVHRSGLGLGAGDLLWWPQTTYSRSEVVARLRDLPLASSFRGTYAYDNVLYIVAGELVESVTGRTWEEFVAERILARVGMTGSNVRHSAAARGGNVAVPHARVDGRVRPIAPFVNDATNAAGGINTSAEDIARWLVAQLNRGRLADGTRLFSEATARQLTTVVTPMPIADPPEGLAPLKAAFRGYALGIEARDYRGHRLLTHTGGLPGYVSRIAMLPDAGVGVAVLTNQESTAAHDAIAWRVLDQCLGVEPFDWIDAYARVDARVRAARTAVATKTEAARDATSRPSLPLGRYTGTYRDAWYGDITIAAEQGRLVIRFSRTPALVGDLEPWQHDTFVARWRDRELRADAFVTFMLTPDGGIDHAKMEAVSPETDFSYDFQDLYLNPVRR